MPTYYIGFTGTGLRVVIPSGMSDDDADKRCQDAIDDLTGGYITDWWVEDIEDEASKGS